MRDGSSEELLPVNAAREGCTDAWDILFRRYQLPLFTYVRELVRDEQAALDVVQEAFVAAARHIATLRDNGKFGSWLFGVARQKCAQRSRRRRIDTAPLDETNDAPTEPEDGPDRQLVADEDAEAFLECLDALDTHHRAVLVLHFIEDFSIREIAEIEAVPEGTVKSRIHHAKRALRKKLEAYENAT